ncbi:N-acetyl-gamma-glutamyl-phosphate reductase [Frankliniella fusca]|uniref:N-acetyl-gamma-glutamyl-phosphate reductase n=1 Tax=Frankliniella fusca TaxID=407009 RepID=A0AAE1LT84_9NEOP|nr:N-acetyl-gamma-glutamyl-phosphate reductase [Frankliniella fusca]
MEQVTGRTREQGCRTREQGARSREQGAGSKELRELGQRAVCGWRVGRRRAERALAVAGPGLAWPGWSMLARLQAPATKVAQRALRPGRAVFRAMTPPGGRERRGGGGGGWVFASQSARFESPGREI